MTLCHILPERRGWVSTVDLTLLVLMILFVRLLKEIKFLYLGFSFLAMPKSFRLILGLFVAYYYNIYSLEFFTIGIIVTFMFHGFSQFSSKVELFISLFTFFQFYSVVNRDSKVDSFADFFLIIMRSSLVAEIK